MLYISDIIYVLAGTKNPKIVVQNNAYVINKKLKEKTTWRCVMYYKNKCSSRIVTQGKTVNIVTGHNHLPIEPSLTGAIQQRVNIIHT